MECVADHCASDVLMCGCETSAFFMAGIILKTMERFGVFLFHGERLEIGLEITIKDNKKEVRISSNPF